ncbi:DNA/RNA non-specific endonuclease [Aquisphaera giovannonii]|uniref:Serine protease n=1 Tax=Aquisphaera giovannonii TaxID=406548 RepID=A0A5B9WF53_9BACT|nr:DNA/RNA non-specific endonuclease [Aquisphaera giovannonii]QEH38889.1 DNA/RNA non-specific endonuclease [Aquisphaera giovannonii]
MLSRQEKLARLKTIIRRIHGGETDATSLADQAEERAGFESIEAPLPAPPPLARPEDARKGIEKVLTDRDQDVSDDELNGLEAIVLTEGRPAVFIDGGKYGDLPNPWTSLNDPAMRAKIQPLFASIGRVDLPNSLQIPYGGTGFVVGDGLLMTNRHVGALFTAGLGLKNLIYTSGDAAIDFLHERSTRPDDSSASLVVKQVVMIHPYWDMALLRVEGLPPARRPLTLSTASPDDLAGRDVVAIGYPARDIRNDLNVQDRIFGGVYAVKRLMPGKLLRRDSIRSFENTVSAITHDSSTLGGNSGSAVIDVRTGQVVGLHFAGLYLKANYAVPAYELARDPRVVDAGLNFDGKLPPSTDTDAAWARLQDVERVADRSTPPPPPPPPDLSQQQPAGPATGTGTATSVAVGAGAVTWTIPLQVTIAIGQPAAVVQAAVAAPPQAGEVQEKLQVPVIAPDLASRPGYKPDFLGLPNGELVPLPDLTPAGKKVVAKLEDGTSELKYQHFSVVVNKQRRLPLFTASNVDYQPAMRLINGRKPSRKELTGLGPNDQEQWVTDPRIPDANQLPDVFFTKDGGAFDKGHVVRRDDVTWGADFAEMQKGNGDTFHTTNCTPQVAGFNRSANGEDNWGDLENLIQKETSAETVCIFSGPVLADDDRTFQGRDRRGPAEVKIPKAFWKIVVAKGDDGPQAFGFVLEQDLSAVPLEAPLEEFAVPAPWKRFMKSIAEIEGLLHNWVKLTWLKEHDAIGTDQGRRIAEGVRKSGRGVD